VVPVIRYWTEYTETAPPTEGANQESVTLAEVIEEPERPDACPGIDVAELPALIEANMVVPPEYVTQ
jgi:hypothetical protein